MLSFQEKIEILEKHLSDVQDNYADSFKTDILFHFDDYVVENVELHFLHQLKSEDEITQWINSLTSQIVMKFDEEQESISDFIYYYIN